MEDNERKNRKRSLIFLIVTIVLLLIVIALTVLVYLKYNDEIKENKKLKKEYKEVTQTLNTTKDEYLKEKENADYYLGLNGEISKIKQEVYKLTLDLEKEIQEGTSSYKIAYLTFDDGPYYLTNSVIDVLKEKKVKATFFTIGLNKDVCFDNSYADCSIMYKKIVDNGHTIANHTYSHLIFNGLYSSTDSFLNQVKQQEDMIKERTGATTNIVRFPGGSATAGYLKNSIIDGLRNMGYGWVDWTAQDGDGGNLTDSSTAWSNLMYSMNDKIEVVLFHDYNRITYSILGGFIDWCEQNNYLVLPLTYDSVAINK